MSEQEPTVITLDNQNSVQILAQYIEVAQQKGAYLLNEAEILKRGMDVLMNNIHDKEIDTNMAKQLLIQGVNKGQRHGAYTLNDAALLSKVVLFVAQETAPAPASAQVSKPTIPVQAAPVQAEQVQAAPVQEEQVQAAPVQEEPEDSDDLSDLAEPIPLKPKEV
jgi:hypothetical protein